MGESILVISFLLDDLLKNNLITEKQLMLAKEMIITQNQENNEDENAA